jgi:transposase
MMAGPGTPVLRVSRRRGLPDLAADFLPPVWQPDERTRSLRRQVMRRAHVVRQRTRIKNRVHAILSRNRSPLTAPNTARRQQAAAVTVQSAQAKTSS